MAFSGITKLIQNLTAKTTVADTDNFIFGGSDIFRITFANLVKAIGGATISTLQTDSKEIVGAINELNTDIASNIVVVAKQIAIKHNTGFYQTSISVAKDGYHAIGVTGHSVNTTFVSTQAAYVDDHENLFICTRNIYDKDDANTYTLTVWILYKKI